MKLAQLCLTLMVVLVISCGDSSSDVTEIKFALKEGQVADDGDQMYTPVDIRFVVRHIELDLPDEVVCQDVEDQLEGASCLDGERVIRVDGPMLVDLKSGKVMPSIDNIRVPDLAYKRVDVRIDDDKDKLLDGEHSWNMKSSFEHEGQTYSMEVLLKFNEDIRFERVGGVSVGSGPLLVSFDPTLWLKGLDITRCLDEGHIKPDGNSIIISDDSDLGECDGYEGMLKENLKKSGQLDK